MPDPGSLYNRLALVLALVATLTLVLLASTTSTTASGLGERVWHVYSNGTVIAPDGRVMIVKEPISYATGNALPNDIVIVHSGVYGESVTINKNLTIIGEGMPTIEKSPFSYSSIYIANNASLEITGIKLSYGIEGYVVGNLVIRGSIIKNALYLDEAYGNVYIVNTTLVSTASGSTINIDFKLDNAVLLINGSSIGEGGITVHYKYPGWMYISNSNITLKSIIDLYNPFIIVIENSSIYLSSINSGYSSEVFINILNSNITATDNAIYTYSINHTHVTISRSSITANKKIVSAERCGSIIIEKSNLQAPTIINVFELINLLITNSTLNASDYVVFATYLNGTIRVQGTVARVEHPWGIESNFIYGSNVRGRTTVEIIDSTIEVPRGSVVKIYAATGKALSIHVRNSQITAAAPFLVQDLDGMVITNSTIMSFGSPILQTTYMKGDVNVTYSKLNSKTSPILKASSLVGVTTIHLESSEIVGYDCISIDYAKDYNVDIHIYETNVNVTRTVISTPGRVNISMKNSIISGSTIMSLLSYSGTITIENTTLYTTNQILQADGIHEALSLKIVNSRVYGGTSPITLSIKGDSTSEAKVLLDQVVINGHGYLDIDVGKAILNISNSMLQSYSLTIYANTSMTVYSSVIEGITIKGLSGDIELNNISLTRLSLEAGSHTISAINSSISSISGVLDRINISILSSSVNHLEIASRSTVRLDSISSTLGWHDQYLLIKGNNPVLIYAVNSRIIANKFDLEAPNTTIALEDSYYMVNSTNIQSSTAVLRMNNVVAFNNSIIQSSGTMILETRRSYLGHWTGPWIATPETILYPGAGLTIHAYSIEINTLEFLDKPDGEVMKPVEYIAERGRVVLSSFNITAEAFSPQEPVGIILFSNAPLGCSILSEGDSSIFIAVTHRSSYAKIEISKVEIHGNKIMKPDKAYLLYEPPTCWKLVAQGESISLNNLTSGTGVLIIYRVEAPPESITETITTPTQTIVSVTTPTTAITTPQQTLTPTQSTQATTVPRETGVRLEYIVIGVAVIVIAVAAALIALKKR